MYIQFHIVNWENSILKKKEHMFHLNNKIVFSYQL